MTVVSLDYVKHHLNIPSASTSNDTELQGVIDAAVNVVTEIVGPIDPVTITEVHDGGTAQLVLSTWPVLSVTSVTDTLRAYVYPSDASTGCPYYTVNGNVISLTPVAYAPVFPQRFPAGFGSLTVVYQAGRASASAKLQLATAELVRHLWQSQQGSRMNAQSEDWSSAMAFAVPNRVRELLGQDARPPGVG